MRLANTVIPPSLEYSSTTLISPPVLNVLPVVSKVVLKFTDAPAVVRNVNLGVKSATPPVNEILMLA
jgi:hypothetical protein